MLFIGRTLPTGMKKPLDNKRSPHDKYKEFATYYIPLLRAFNLQPTNTASPSLDFFKVVHTFPEQTNVLISAGEIDCRGPIINVAHRTNRSLFSVTMECIEKFLEGLNYLKYELKLNPIVLGPNPNKFTTKITDPYLKLPEFLSPTDWFYLKMDIISIFTEGIKRSNIPIISILDWVKREKIAFDDSYWVDTIHMSEKVWPKLIEEFSRLGITITLDKL